MCVRATSDRVRASRGGTSNQGWEPDFARGIDSEGKAVNRQKSRRGVDFAREFDVEGRKKARRGADQGQARKLRAPVSPRAVAQHSCASNARNPKIAVLSCVEPKKVQKKSRILLRNLVKVDMVHT